MEERELPHWVDALAEAGLIGEWQWDLKVESGEPTGIQYWIDGRRYTHDGAVKLVRTARWSGNSKGFTQLPPTAPIGHSTRT